MNNRQKEKFCKRCKCLFEKEARHNNTMNADRLFEIYRSAQCLIPNQENDEVVNEIS